MLHFMRKHAKFFYVFFFLIIISFIFFYSGIGPVDKNAQPYLVKVGKEKIMPDEYWRVYENMRNFYRDVYKDRFNAEMEKQLNLKDKVLSEMVSETILYVAAGDAGLVVTDQELTDSIVNEPAFQREGKFRQDVYVNTLRLMRITPKYYERKKREELLVRKMRQLIEESVVVSDEEVPALQGNEELQKNLRRTIIQGRKAEAVEAYVEALKKKYDVVVKADLIS
jgi:peptidyl-prolyl cis-trans isomerase D